jgi:CheY-like chemotaxis protein
MILDAAGRWETSANGHRVVVVAADPDAAGRAIDLEPAEVLVNLAHPDALTVATELRAAGCSARFWGCMADAAAGRGVLLGLVEPVARPLDPNLVLALLEQHGTQAARVLTVGEEVDAFISLRQALTRHRMSVSMAWNGKQAADLLPMVRPQVMVLDLALPPGDAAPVVGQLAASAPLPLTVLVAGTKDAAPAFATALAAAASAGSVASLTELLGRMRAASAA